MEIFEDCSSAFAIDMLLQTAIEMMKEEEEKTKESAE